MSSHHNMLKVVGFSSLGLGLHSSTLFDVPRLLKMSLMDRWVVVSVVGLAQYCTPLCPFVIMTKLDGNKVT